MRPTETAHATRNEKAERNATRHKYIRKLELLLERDERTETYTAGRLYADGKHVCDTVEDTDRDANRNGVFDGAEQKVYAKTAIPNGRYRVTLEHSPRFSPRYDGRRVPTLHGVPHFTNVLIHTGNTADDSAGCIIVGKRAGAGVVQHSKATFIDALLPLLFDAERRGEEIYITVL